MSIITELKEELISIATEQYGQIVPCGGKKTLSDCFSIINGKLLLWFNDSMDSTHIMSVEIGENINA